MNRNVRSIVFISLALLAGCERQTQKGIVHTDPPAPPPETIPIAPAPVVPQPSQEDLAFDAARKAAADGDPERAVILYENAASLTNNDDRLAEIYFALGLLHSDPGSLSRDVPRGRQELQRVLDGSPGNPRVRDARILAGLLDEIEQLRAQAAEQRSESDEVKVRLAALTEKLDQKEKELTEIKKILLQGKKKP